MADIRYVTYANMLSLAAEMKAKYTNQDAISTIVVGEGSFEAAEAEDSFEIAAGSNVQLTLSGDTLTIAATDTTYSAVVADSTGATAAGLMTSADKYKLDGIDASADVNVIEGVQVNGSDLTPDANKKVNVTIAAGTTGVGTIKVNGSDVTAYGLGTAAAATVETTGIGSNTTTLATTAQVKEYVDAKATSAYKASGSIAPSGVASSLLVAANEGNVYNLSAAMTLDATSAALFVDGTAGDVITVGTNIVVIDAGSGTYKFDKQAGFVDLSAYAQTADFGGLTAEELAAVIAAL